MAQSPVYDVIVCGLGINGAAALYYLSQKTNLKVLGLEAKEPGHSGGGSYGQTRLLRRSYFENYEYVPLVTKSLELWLDLQKSTPQLLLKKTGLVFLGSNGNEFFDDIEKCSERYDLKIENLSMIDARTRFPFLKIPEHFRILFEHDAYVLFPENLILNMLNHAQKNKNIEISNNTELRKIVSEGGNIFIKTNKNTLIAKKLLLTTGGWTKSLLQELSLPIEIRESPQFWFRENSNSSPVTVPFAIAVENKFVYGFPDFGKGVKMAYYHPGKTLTHPDERSPNSEHGLQTVQNCIEDHFPYVKKEPVNQHTCFFDIGPNENLLLDFHPQQKNIVLVAAGSGHGLKMAPALALAAIDMLMTGQRLKQNEFLSLNY